MVKLLCIITLIFLLLFLPITNAMFIKESIETVKTDYEIKDITPKDDAFHGIKRHISQEWWYFDAVFNKNCGIHIGIKVTSFLKWGFVSQIINIYNETNVEEKQYIVKPLNQFQISTELPDIKYQNQPIMKFDYEEYKKSGKWNYTITLNLTDIQVKLTFNQRSKGFSYVTSHEGWTVAQPKADVEGEIIINQRKIIVNGKGYHDHNWDFSLKTAFRGRGWYWGKISSANYSLTWAKIIKTSFADDTISENLGIINIIDGDYTKIRPENIYFKQSNYEYHNGRFIPTNFRLKINQDNIDLNVTFKAVSIQKTEPDFLTIHYWRYFISVSGYIKVDSNIDYLDENIQIMEFVRFL